MKKRKKILNNIIIIFILIFVFSTISYLIYTNSDYYKLKDLGYKDKDIVELRKYFNSYEEILNNKYSKIIIFYLAIEMHPPVGRAFDPF